jgi:TonB family protein
MNLFEPKKKITVSGFFRKHSTGIYGTVIFHLILLIILLSTKIYTYTAGSKDSFLLLFQPEEKPFIAIPPARTTKAPEVSPTPTTPADVRAQLSRELDRRIASKPLRNVAVDASQRRNQPLRDDRGTDVAKLYDEARAVQERIDAARKAAEQQQGSDEVATPPPPAPASTVTYNGPSVLSYELDGRKHLSLPVPVYQCYGGGDVTVQIEVNPRGYVTSVSIQVSASVDNTCLYEAARRAAMRSRFTVDANAQAKQKGNIVYRFLSQK